ncbi:alpha-ribazole phosphatase family protein, partial [Vibrio sp. 1078-1]|uniref:alpha-ribazole phosphatase family protein n=1 Tax=Vibrio sp. 1078-1 TaxID=3074544 RepID=UPI0029646B48
MKTLNIYLMRHGKVDAAPGLYGQTDLKVKEAEQQRISMAWKTKGYDVAGIISSPLSRCHDLAQVLAEQQLLPMTTEDDLQEMDFGDFDGMPFDLLTEHWKKLDAFWQSPAHHSLPNAESLSTFSQRVSRAWSQIIN